MATFTFVKPSVKSGGGEGSTSYTLLQNRINYLKEIYSDFNGNIIDKKYFEEVANEYQKALNGGGYTVNQQQDIANNLLKSQREYRGWQVTNSKVYNLTKDTLQSEFEDEWTNVWKSNIRNLDKDMVSQDMLNSIDVAKSELLGLKQVLEEETNDTDKIEQVNDLLESVNERESFWRGVQTNPTRYALVADSDANGVYNLQMKEITNIPDKHFKLDGVDYGGVKVYVNDTGEEDDSGNKVLKFGNGVWKGTPSSGFIFDADASGSESFDAKSIKNTPFLSYGEGTIFKKPDGSFYTFDGDGNYSNYVNADLLRMDGFDPDQAITLTEDEADKVKRQFNVSQISSTTNTRTRQAEIQSQLSNVADTVAKEVGPKFSAQDLGSSYMQTLDTLAGGATGLTKEMKDIGKWYVDKAIKPFTDSVNPLKIEEGVNKTYAGFEKVGATMSKGMDFIGQKTKQFFKGVWTGTQK